MFTVELTTWSMYFIFPLCSMASYPPYFFFKQRSKVSRVLSSSNVVDIEAFTLNYKITIEISAILCSYKYIKYKIFWIFVHNL